MRNTLIRILKFIAFLFIGLLLLWLAFRNVKFDKLVEGLKGADYKWVVLSMLFGVAAYISRARRWNILIKPLGHSPALGTTFYAMMTGYLANLALPRVGEITRCVALGKKEKIPVDQLIGTVVIERTVDLMSLLSIMLVLILIRGAEINEFLRETIFIPLQEKVFSLLGFTRVIWMLIAFVLVLSLFLLFRNRRRLRKFVFFSKMFDLARGIFNGFKTIASLSNKWEFVFHTVFIWVCYMFMTWVVVFAIEPTAHITLGDSIFLLVVGGLGMSVPVQGGIGAFHYAVSRGLAFVEGVNLEDGLVYAFLSHESQLLVVIVLGVISFFMIFRKNNKIP